MRSALFFILAFCCSFAHADKQSIQYLHEVSSNSYLYTASMMVYFNPKDRTPDERSLTAVFGAINVMDTKVTQLGNPPEMRAPLDEMNSIFLSLEKAKRSQSATFPAKIQRVLQLNKQMQEAVAKSYNAEMTATPSSMALLNEQSQAIAYLLMDYQLRRYPLEDKSAYGMDPAQLPEVDKQIDANFILLLKQYPANADYLEPAYKNYRFVRKQLLQSKGRPNGGAEFYMTRTVIDLDDLATELSVEDAR